MASRSDYGPNPHEGRSRNNATARGWGSGWPNCQSSRMVRVSKAGVAVYVRREIGELVATLLSATERVGGYDVKDGQTWGFACRPIRGTSTPSNHSWGLAVDLNSLANPMGSRFVTDLPPDVVDMWESCGFYWGGRYRNRPDAMHFEFLDRPGDVAGHLNRAERILNGSVGSGGSVDYESYRDDVDPGDRTVRLGDAGDDVKAAQTFIGASKTGPADGYFGPKTRRGVRWYQDMRGIEVDGVIGKVTWSHILGNAEPARPTKPLDGRTVDYSNLRHAARTGWKDGGDSSVENVQRALNYEFGGSDLAIDGIFGPKTRSRYSAWQKRLGYRGTDADGIPGRTSLNRLADRYGFRVTA